MIRDEHSKKIESKTKRKIIEKSGLKPKKLLDITNMNKFDSNESMDDEGFTFKAPFPSKSITTSKKIKSFDDLNTDDETDDEDKVKEFPISSSNDKRKKVIVQQMYINLEGEFIATFQK